MSVNIELKKNFNYYEQININILLQTRSCWYAERYSRRAYFGEHQSRNVPSFVIVAKRIAQKIAASGMFLRYVPKYRLRTISRRFTPSRYRIIKLIIYPIEHLYLAYKSQLQFLTVKAVGDFFTKHHRDVGKIFTIFFLDFSSSMGLRSDKFDDQTSQL